MSLVFISIHASGRVRAGDRTEAGAQAPSPRKNTCKSEHTTVNFWAHAPKAVTYPTTGTTYGPHRIFNDVLVSEGLEVFESGYQDWSSACHKAG